MMHEGSTLTFQNFDQKATSLAKFLSEELKLTANYRQAPVIIAMGPSWERFVAILAVLKLRIPYIPIEISVPRSRVKLIIKEAMPQFIIHDAQLEGTIRT